MTGQELILKLEAAQHRRASLQSRLLDEGTTAFRLFNGSADGWEKLVVEIYATVAVFHLYDAKESQDLWKEAAEWLVSRAIAKSVYAKQFEPERFRTKSEKPQAPSLLAGKPSQEEVTVLESGLNYLLRPYSGLSSGLFLDQRDNRKLLAQLSHGERVLNGFSYTCAFSVACAAQSAEVTSVDVSKKALEWGKRNFALNDISLEPHRFYADDIFEFYQRAHKRKDRFDVVILDPPSFGRNPKGKPFSVFRDWRRLLEGALTLLEPKGTLFFSSNLSKWDSKFLTKIVGDLLQGAGRSGKPLPLPRTPEDFGSVPTLSATLFQLVN